MALTGRNIWFDGAQDKALNIHVLRVAEPRYSLHR